MAQLSKTAFLSKWATLFADNTTGEISEQDVRDFRQDIADSFLSISDNYNFRGSHDLSTEAYPASGGTGVGGIPAIGNEWYGINSGEFDVFGLGTIELTRGATLLYIGGTVTNASSWIVKQ